MKKALIIGAAGFVGKYLIKELYDTKTIEVHATKLPHETVNFLDDTEASIHNLDILNKDEVVKLFYEVRPDYIFHLAAQSSVSLSWKNPALTVDINIKGAVNVMDAVRELYYKPRVLLIGSGEEYGHIKPDETPINEDNHLRPGNIYAATKVCQNMIGKIYTQAYDMDMMMVRAFNHVGPTQAPMFVVSDFCKQVVEIEKGLREPVMNVGNLAAKRDFTDVRDVVKAYRLIVEKGVAGETYNVGSGNAYAIQEILDKIIEISGLKIEVKVDPNKIRPVDVPIIEADITKLSSTTGWKPEISLTQTLTETIEYWRSEVK